MGLDRISEHKLENIKQLFFDFSSETHQNSHSQLSAAITPKDSEI